MKPDDMDLTEIYEVSFNFSKPPGIECFRDDLNNFDVYRLYDGKLINDWPTAVTFYCQVSEDDDFVKGGLHWILISDRVRNLFENINIQGVQFLPVTIVDERRIDAHYNYWVLNVYQTTPSFRWNEVKNLKIFRLSGRRGTSIFISDHLRQSLADADLLKGLSCIRVPRDILEI